MNTSLLIICTFCAIYEVFGNLHSFWYQSVIKQGSFELSNLEQKLFRESGLKPLLVMIFFMITRVNGIAFLLYFGYKISFIVAALLWVSTLVISTLLANFVKRKFLTGYAIPALLGFFLIPICAFFSWLLLVNY